MFHTEALTLLTLREKLPPAERKVVAVLTGEPCSDPATDAASMKGIPAGGPRWSRLPTMLRLPVAAEWSSNCLIASMLRSQRSLRRGHKGRAAP